MADFNKIILIGRLTRDPEARTFGNGGKVVKFGLAASPTRKKNQQTGEWESEPMFIDCEVYTRGDYASLVNLVEERCRKGSQICIEGKLHFDQWDDKTSGQKRSKHKVIADSIVLLDSRQGGGDGPGGMESEGGMGGMGGGGGGRSSSSNRGGGYAPRGNGAPPSRSGGANSNTGNKGGGYSDQFDSDDSNGDDGGIPF